MASTARAFLADFGLARWGTGQPGLSPPGSRLTRTGTTLGTPAYMSPEQARGEGTGQPGLSPASDCWSLGCVLYECLTGRRAFEGDAPAEVVARVVSGRPVPLRRLRPEVPAGICDLIDACLAPDPGARPAQAGALSDDARRLLAGGRPRARAPHRGRRAWVLAVLAAGAALAAWHWSATRARESFSTVERDAEAEAAAIVRGARRLSAQDPRAAAESLERALAIAPHRAEWRIDLGLYRWAAGETERARAEWQAVPEGSAAHTDAVYWRAVEAIAAFWDERDPGSDAAEAIQRAGTLPGDRGRIVRGAIAAQERRPEEARTLLAGVEGWVAAAFRGHLESNAPDRDPRRVAREFEAAVRDSPRFDWIDFGLAEAHHLAGDLEQAAADYGAIRQRRPGDPMATLGVATAWLALDRLAESRPLFDEAVAAAPGNHLVWFNRAGWWEKAGDLAAAERDVDEALRLRPDLPQVRLKRAWLREGRGDLRGALADLDGLLARDPRDVRAMTNRGSVLIKLGRHREALAQYDAALAVDPAIYQARFSRAELRLRFRDPDGALQDYAVVRELQPDLVPALVGAAMAHVQRRERTQALALLERATSLAPDYALAWYCLGGLRSDLGAGRDPEGADAALARFLELAPTDERAPLARRLRAELAAERQRR